MTRERDLGVVYVTGGASGLGAAVVEAVAKAGGTPAVIDIAPPPDEGVAHAMADLSDSSAAEAAVADLVSRVGPPQAVVTAAGTDACGPLAEIDTQTWERVVRVNLFGTAAVVRACLPHLEEVRGTVVTVASTLGLRPAGDATAYCASKFGVVGFTRALAMELAGRVGVTLLVPGGMRTHFFDGRTEQYKPGPDAELNDPADVAQTVLMALRQPVGCEVREMVVATSTEPSWP
ncbi:NADP-dependent 3-hydroxy acid dehydrogenase YdfG [Pedococcus cremeus]|uniref:NADP-dependent 3-hydroxy acid dehydrogenase YdfG n=1 Tax=Pedococcus cremeus TaxID=587636 RepID=A0A1H9QY05_9MICO|nr:SDR family oxidoreductase [Pedococcus cremeus]SER65115.1 NADP-dependent 3-hydroxy acid dehydrogenase YdfG [Pedococcus cremeus]